MDALKDLRDVQGYTKYPTVIKHVDKYGDNMFSIQMHYSTTGDDRKDFK